MRKAMWIVMVMLLVMLAAAGVVGAQDLPGETGPAVDVWSWIDRNDVMIAVVVVIAVVVFVLRPALVKLVEGLAASVPEGFARDAVVSIKDGVVGTLERYIEAREREAALTPSPLDDAALDEIHETLRLLNARLDELLKVQDAARG